MAATEARQHEHTYLREPFGVLACQCALPLRKPNRKLALLAVVCRAATLEDLGSAPNHPFTIAGAGSELRAP